MSAMSLASDARRPVQGKQPKAGTAKTAKRNGPMTKEGEQAERQDQAELKKVWLKERRQTKFLPSLKNSLENSFLFQNFHLFLSQHCCSTDIHTHTHTHTHPTDRPLTGSAGAALL